MVLAENNYETAIRTYDLFNQADLVIIWTMKAVLFWVEPELEIRFDQILVLSFVERFMIKTFWSIYPQGAFAYIHGQEVGGTNPGLLEALPRRIWI